MWALSLVFVCSGGIHAQDPWWFAPEATLVDSTPDDLDSLWPARGGIQMAGTSSRAASSARSALRWEDPRGIGMVWARSQPGGLRRRQLSSSTRTTGFVAGDLDPWTDSPLLEGASRQWGSTTRDESEAWLRGSGRIPNGLESRLAQGRLQVRSRWREDRRSTENVRSAALEIGWAGFFAGARSEGPRDRRCATAGFRNDRWSLSALADENGWGGARWEGSSTTLGLRGELRWVSAAMRHGGLPSGWSGATFGRLSWKNPADDPWLDGIRLEADRKDEVDRILGQGRLAHHWDPVGIALRPSTVWKSGEPLHGSASVRVDRSDDAPWKPSLEGAWSDTAAGCGFSGGGQIAWSRSGRSSAAGILWREEAPLQVFAEQTGTVRTGRRSVEISLGIRSSVGAEPEPVAQGGLSCAW